MHRVTRPTGTPPRFLVHVDKVQIALPIAKLSDADPLLRHGKALDVALETKSIRFDAKRSIEGLRVGQGQQV